MAGVPPIGEFAGGVVAVALMAAIEALFVGQLVGEVVGEPGAVVVFIEELD